MFDSLTESRHGDIGFPAHNRRRGYLPAGRFEYHEARLLSPTHARPCTPESTTTPAPENTTPREERTIKLSPIPDALAALRTGRPVIVVDDDDRENEGDIVLAAELATPEWIAWTVRVSSGFICAPLTNEIADHLNLPPMVEMNEDPRGTAYTVTVDAANRLTTGISAADRANTLRVLADPTSTPASLFRPGHIVPLRAVDGGVRARNGHTEAAIDLLLLAGLRPVAAIAEVVGNDGEMMRLEGLLALGAENDVPVIAIAELATWLDEADQPNEHDQ